MIHKAIAVFLLSAGTAYAGALDLLPTETYESRGSVQVLEDERGMSRVVLLRSYEHLDLRQPTLKQRVKGALRYEHQLNTGENEVTLRLKAQPKRSKILKIELLF